MTDCPVATYRIQLSPAFRFADAAAVLPHIQSLGVSHLYLSPIFEAVPGSTHGYDQTDPSRIRAELGGRDGFLSLSSAAARLGLKVLVDIVPNHMATHHTNPWWWGLLKNGKNSRFDRFFDVDWSAAADRVVLPVLGRPVDECIERGEIRIDASDDASLVYYDKRFPLRPDALPADLRSVSGAQLATLISRQHYELAEWREGLRRINYRRFFDIADLAGVRVEDPGVVEDLHAGVFALISEGHIHGLRLDHVDGLLDPRSYCRTLRERLNAIAPPGVRPWIIVEKILGPHETLPSDWGLDGTTGYDFLSASLSLLVPQPVLQRCRDEAAASGAAAPSFSSLRVRCKAEAAALLGPELEHLVSLAGAAAGVADCPLSPHAARECLVAICARLDVYRTYVDDDGISEADAARIRSAAALAEPALSQSAREVLAVLTDLLTLDGSFDEGPARAAAQRLIRRWQQFTGPVAAKGVEDTALYRDAAHPALNEVGSEPELHDPEARLLSLLHERAESFPYSMNATATHDTKRGEDTRARIAAALASEEGRPLLAAARRACEPLRTRANGQSAPAPSDVNLVLTAALALVPIDEALQSDLATRLTEYIRKAAREAKVHTSWLDPDQAYESACGSFVERLSGEAGTTVRSELVELATRTRGRALQDSVSLVFLKCLGPGVPDVYQGCETLDLSLVDPDNRRPVRWSENAELLRSVRDDWEKRRTLTLPEGISDSAQSAAKLALTWRALSIRRWLLSEGGPIRITDWHMSSARWRWAFRAGAITGDVWVNLTDGQACPGTTGFNQIPTSRPSPFGLVLENVAELI